MIYLASPYSSGSNRTREEQYEAVNRCFVYLLKQQTPAPAIFCPIAHSHHQSDDLPKTHEWWLMHDVGFLKQCDELWICCLSGWRESTGVLVERCVAHALGIPIKYVVPSYNHFKTGLTWDVRDDMPN